MKKNNESAKNKKFRLRGKKLFLTYPQLDTSIEFLKEEALKQLQTKIKNIGFYLISEEQHEDGGIHLHCYFELNIKIDLSDVNYLDLLFNGVLYHGNYQIGKKKQALLDYIVKDENFITNMTIHIKDGRVLKPEEHLFEVCKNEGYNKAEENLYELYPLLAARKASSLLKNLSKLSKFKTIQKIEENQVDKVFAIEDFDKLSNNDLKEIEDWVQKGISSGFSITLVLWGPPGTGKTQLGKAIFDLLKIDFIEISNIQDFKQLDLTKHRGILIDDLDTIDLDRGIILNILDSRASKTVPVKYGAVSTESYIPRIVTTNDLDALYKGGFEELKRRTKTIFISSKISSKFDIQINIQNIDNSINNYYGDNIGVSKDKLNIILERLENLLKDNNIKNNDIIDIK